MSNMTLLSYDFPVTLWKKIYHLLKKEVETYNIETIYPIADWPHISVALISDITEKEREVLRLAAPALAGNFKIQGLTLLRGKSTPYDYLTLDLKPDGKFNKLFDFILELVGPKRVKDYRTKESPEHIPHVSVLLISPNDHDALLSKVKDLEKLVRDKGFMWSVKPEQFLFWDDFKISEIDKAIVAKVKK